MHMLLEKQKKKVITNLFPKKIFAKLSFAKVKVNLRLQTPYFS